jgi:magnesium transporter
MKVKSKPRANELEISLQKLLKKHHDPKILKTLMKKYRPVDLAEVLNDFEEEKDVLKILNIANDDLKAEIFVELDFELQEYVIRHLTNNDLKPLVKEIYSDDLVDIIDEMPATIVERILNVAGPQKRQELNHILKNEAESAGANMAVDFIKLNKDLTVAQARTVIFKNHYEVETVDNLYIIDEYGTLLGEIKLKDLVINASNKKLSKIMETNFVTVQERADQEEIVELFKKYDLTALPVINVENKIIGIITAEDVIDVMEQEQTEDLERFVGISPLEDSFFKTSI